MPRRMGDIYVGEENGVVAKRLAKRDPLLSIAMAHTHTCTHCAKSFYCWCWNPEGKDHLCLTCNHEALLPRVVKIGKGWAGYRTSKLFSHIEVSQGGWTSQWVSTSELRAALKRWVGQEYKAGPPEVTEEAGAYQCGGCRFFLALNGDYGICANPASRYDGRIVFEHIGCEANPFYIKNHEVANGTH